MSTAVATRYSIVEMVEFSTPYFVINDNETGLLVRKRDGREYRFSSRSGARKQITRLNSHNLGR